MARNLRANQIEQAFNQFYKNINNMSDYEMNRFASLARNTDDFRNEIMNLGALPFTDVGQWDYLSAGDAIGGGDRVAI